MGRSVRLPVIFCDVDGVLVKSSMPIEPAGEILEKILGSQKCGMRIPFFCLTNNGCDTEEVKAEKYNKVLGLTEPKL
jgi:ribonucleotide monophosphatase NagD (HAD superfamily)